MWVTHPIDDSPQSCSLKFGLSGTTGIFFVMALAGMVCVALCAPGQFITDLKAGYWIGSTPAAQERVKFIGVVAAARVGGEHGKTIRERGIIIAGGLMAGGALGGVIGAALRVLPNFKEEWIQTPFYGNMAISQSVSALFFIGICLYVWFGSLKKEKEI